MTYEVRDYRPTDERSWLRCRVLSFLGTAYFDDVRTSKPHCPPPGFALVAVESEAVIGALDVTVEGTLATIDTIAVHPDHQHRGIGATLFQHACHRAAAAGSETIDAWTRDDEATLRWYRSRGFTESSHYLHVYANHHADAAEPTRAVEARPGLRPVTVFLRAALDQEEEVRRNFSRVHICRRFSRPVTPQPPSGGAA